MSLLASLRLIVEVVGEDGVETAWAPEPTRFTPASLLPKREVVSLTGSAFTALSPPSGAKAAIIDVGTSVSLTLKGLTGDSGTTVAPASSPIGLPLVVPLGATPSIGFANGSSTEQTVTVWWV